VLGSDVEPNAGNTGIATVLSVETEVDTEVDVDVDVNVCVMVEVMVEVLTTVFVMVAGGLPAAAIYPANAATIIKTITPIPSMVFEIKIWMIKMN